MWRNVKFLQIWQIPHFSTYVVWKNLKFLYMWRNFGFLHIWHVLTSEISPRDQFFFPPLYSWSRWQISGMIIVLIFIYEGTTNFATLCEDWDCEGKFIIVGLQAMYYLSLFIHYINLSFSGYMQDHYYLSFISIIIAKLQAR